MNADWQGLSCHIGIIFGAPPRAGWWIKRIISKRKWCSPVWSSRPISMQMMIWLGILQIKSIFVMMHPRDPPPNIRPLYDASPTLQNYATLWSKKAATHLSYLGFNVTLWGVHWSTGKFTKTRTANPGIAPTSSSKQPISNGCLVKQPFPIFRFWIIQLKQP